MVRKLFILEIEQLEGEDTAIYLESDGEAVRSLYAVIAVDTDGAHIVDNSYRSIGEAAEAWPEAVVPLGGITQAKRVQNLELAAHV